MNEVFFRNSHPERGSRGTRVFRVVSACERGLGRLAGDDVRDETRALGAHWLNSWDTVDWKIVFERVSR